MIIQSKNIEVNNSESEKQALEERFQTDTNQPWDLQKNIASLRFELQALKESNRILEDQIQNDASINTDLTTQLTETELKEAYHKILALEVELKSKYHYCEELDTMC
jgi:chromosome segregation ATPase